MNVIDICKLAPVIPVLTVEEPEVSVPLAKVLLEGGLPAIEVTLRTPKALEVIRAMSRIEGAVVGAGTLLSSKDVWSAKEAGAKFGVSPGCTPALLNAAMKAGLPLLPGVATASELMILLDQGVEVVKFFPAHLAGGAPYIKALQAPFPNICFCPTGGITAENAEEYLLLPNVVCVGGSWVVPRTTLEKRDWTTISELTAVAANLKTSQPKSTTP